MPEKTFFVANFGCRATQADGASIHEELLESNVQEARSLYEAGVVIINSCTVTEEADREVRQTIRRVARRNPDSRIIVTGCYAQRRPEELAAMPQVRYVVGNSHKPMVGQLALDVLDEDFSSHGRAEILCSSIFLEKQLKPSPYLGSGGRTRAIVKLQDGCNANCSFCIIPSVRGRSRSLPREAVLCEVENLVERGFKEVIFSGIHMGSYGRDLVPKTSLLELLHRTLEMDGLERLRLSSIEPLEVTPELITLMAEHPRMAHHFHIPLQSGSARILRAMRRPYSPEYYAALVARIRSRIPTASIGADVMAGFPGESDEDFRSTIRLIEDSPLTYLHVFPYSPRPGTVAAEMPHRIPEHVKRFRARALRELIRRNNEAFRLNMIGSTLDVLVLGDKPENGWREAISENFIRVRVPAEVGANQWIRARVMAMDGEGLQASSMTTAEEMRWSCVSET